MLPIRLGIQSLNRVEVILALLHKAHNSTPYLFHTLTLPIMSSVYRYSLLLFFYISMIYKKKVPRRLSKKKKKYGIFLFF